MLRKNIILTLLFIFAAPCACNGQDNTGFDKGAFIKYADTDRVIKLGISDCIRYVLEKNSEIKMSRLDARIAGDYVRMANAEFEPVLSGNYNLYDSKKESSTLFGYPDAVTIRDIDFNANISGKIPTGTEYTLSFLNTRYKSNSSIQKYNPYYSASPVVTLTQPIFKGSGVLVNRADVIIAKNNKAQSDESFKNMVMEMVTGVQAAYYRYLFGLDNYSIALLSLDRAKDLLETNRVRYKKGLASSVDLLETEAAVADREKALISAESGLKTAEDNLKLLTNLTDDPQLWNAKVEIVDRPQPGVNNADLAESLEKAFQFRPDYEAAKIDLKNRDIKVKVSKNGLLPAIDLVGSYGLNGLDGDYRESVDKINSQHRDWGVGVECVIPWGGGDRAAYDEAKLQKERALIAFKRLEQNIILDVRDKVRSVDIQSRQLNASELYKEKETQNYQAKKDAYEAGQVSTHDMLDYQDRLMMAELGYTQALIDYNIAVINLDKAQGLTLTRNNIALEE